MRNMKNILITLLLVMGIVLPTTAACSSADSHQHEMADLADMPMSLQQSPVRVQEAYQFAVANPEITQAIPCYCGCGPMGHTSNYSCYVADEATNGTLTFDEHALSCGICVDITQDTMQMLDEGVSVEEMFEIIDGRYAHFGPPTPLE